MGFGPRKEGRDHPFPFANAYFILSYISYPVVSAKGFPGGGFFFFFQRSTRFTRDGHPLPSIAIEDLPCLLCVTLLCVVTLR